MGCALLGLALVAASCGGSSDEGATAGTVDPGIKEGVKAATESTTAGGPTTTVPAPTSMDEWEDLWADQRQEALDRIKENGWGTSAGGKTVTGPGGFEIDWRRAPPAGRTPRG